MTDGVVTLQSLRQMSETKTIPVIFVTGVMSNRIYPLIGLNSRVSHLKKPLDLDHLRSMVQLFLQRYPVIA